MMVVTRMYLCSSHGIDPWGTGTCIYRLSDDRLLSAALYGDFTHMSTIPPKWVLVHQPNIFSNWHILIRYPDTTRKCKWIFFWPLPLFILSYHFLQKLRQRQCTGHPLTLLSPCREVQESPINKQNSGQHLGILVYGVLIKGALFWGYSGYSYSSLGITEYAEFQFRKECSSTRFRSGNGIGGDLRTTISVHTLECAAA